jgi:hypothetical protein
MRFRMVMAVMAIGCCASVAMAQMPEAVPVGTLESPAKALDKMLGMYEYQAMGVVKAMPADKYSFAPSAGTFAAGSAEKFDGVRTFAAEITHVAEANYYFYAGVSGLKPDVDVKSIATITAENAFVGIKPIDGMDTRASLAAFGVAHGYDHYGQMVEYLRMNGILPPGSK